MGVFNDQLRALRKQSKLSSRRMADALGMAWSTYAAYEDPKKFKKPIIPIDFAERIASVVVPLGVNRSEVMLLAGLTGENSSVSAVGTQEEWLTVTGAVAAGIWRAQTEWPAAEQYDVRFGVSDYSSEKRFAVRMEGLSMNRTILPGSDLECLWVKFSPIAPQPGDLVIVERRQHDLVELTCKRLAMDGDEYILVAESTEPDFQEPIRIGKPDRDDHTDNETRVVGIVLSAKLDLAPKGLSQRRYRS
jgi:SOS-response transcriptional repressor LexA